MKKLKDTGVVAKVKPYYYMIDPNLLMPSNYAKWLARWESITTKVGMPSASV